MYKLELLCNIKNILGEGPIYDYRNKNISWIDIVGMKLYILDKDNNIKCISFNERIGAAIPLNDGYGYLVCGTKSLYLYNEHEIKEIKSLESIMDIGMRCNDAKADSYGRLWLSNMVDDGIHEPNGGFYKYENNELVLFDKAKLGNGLAWSKDNTKLYYADSIEHKVFVYDYDLYEGIISNKKTLFEIKDGSPDGMTIDDNDNLFVAVWSGGRIEIRSGKDGDLIDIIKIPTKLVTSCAFTGDKFDELVVTTASLDEKDEYAGKVFKIKLDYEGRKEYFVATPSCFKK